MAENSKIQWTDASWTPLRARNPRDGKSGWHCVRISPACQNCYASTFNGRRLPNGGTGLDYVATSPAESYLDGEILSQPLKWRKPKRIFVCSMTDLFGDWVKDVWIDAVFAIMARCRQHTFQVLTKRADRMHDYLNSPTRQGRINDVSILRDNHAIWLKLRLEDDDETVSGPAWPLPNVWIGVSVENQRYADERIPLLLNTPASVRFLSCEPLLGPVDLPRIEIGDSRNRLGSWCAPLTGAFADSTLIDWVIIGGESGVGARECKFEWIRAILKQCWAADVPAFVKQLGTRPSGDWGENPPTYQLTDMRRGVNHTTTELSQFKNGIWKLRDNKGGFMGEWPEDLRVRQFPATM